MWIILIRRGHCPQILCERILRCLHLSSGA